MYLSIRIFSMGHRLTNINFNSFPFCVSKTLAQILNLYNNSKTHVIMVLKPKDYIIVLVKTHGC